MLKEFNYESNRERMVKESALYLKTVIFDFVYSLSSANIDQSALNLGKIFMSKRILMSLITGPIGRGQLELFALELGKNCCIQLGLLSSIYKYKPVSTKFGHNVCEHKISDEFDYGSSHTRSVRVICP